jgi:hypothetical protein
MKMFFRREASMSAIKRREIETTSGSRKLASSSTIERGMLSTV